MMWQSFLRFLGIEIAFHKDPIKDARAFEQYTFDSDAFSIVNSKMTFDQKEIDELAERYMKILIDHNGNNDVTLSNNCFYFVVNTFLPEAIRTQLNHWVSKAAFLWGNLLCPHELNTALRGYLLHNGEEKRNEKYETELANLIIFYTNQVWKVYYALANEEDNDRFVINFESFMPKTIQREDSVAAAGNDKNLLEWVEAADGYLKMKKHKKDNGK